MKNYFGLPEEIENANCIGMCNQIRCIKPVSHFAEIKIGGTKYILQLCKEHIESYHEDLDYERSKK